MSGSADKRASSQQITIESDNSNGTQHTETSSISDDVSSSYIQNISNQMMGDSYQPSQEANDTVNITHQDLAVDDPKVKRKHLWDDKVKVSSKEVMLVVFTFINCCIGSGLMTVPKIFTSIGFIVAAVYMVASTSYCLWVFSIMNKLGYHGNFESITQMSRKLWGKGFGRLVDICMVCNGIGSIIAYISIAADYIREGIYSFGHVEIMNTIKWKNLMKVIISAVVLFPLSILRSINVISLISSFAIVFALVTVVGINVRFFQYIATGKLSNIEHPMPPVPWTPIPSRWMGCISYFTTFFSLYTIHANISPMQYEIEGLASTRKKIVKKGTNISIAIVCIIYLLVGIEGALIFDRSCTDEQLAEGCIPINSNILLSFRDDTAMMIIKLLYAIVIIVSTPCMLYPVRLSICRWFKIDKYDGKTDVPNKEDSKAVQKMKKNRTPEEKAAENDRIKTLPLSVRLGYLWYILVGLAIIALDVVLSIAIPEIDKVLSIKSNIFGLVLYEIHGVFVCYKMRIVEKHSVGTILDEKFVSTQEYLNKLGSIVNPDDILRSPQDAQNKRESLDQERLSNMLVQDGVPRAKMSIMNRLNRFSQLSISTAGGAVVPTTNGRRNSLVISKVQQPDDMLKDLNIAQLQAELENHSNTIFGEITYNHESDTYSSDVQSSDRGSGSYNTPNSDEQAMPKLEDVIPTQSHSSNEKSETSADSTEKEKTQEESKCPISPASPGRKSSLQILTEPCPRMSTIEYHAAENIDGPVEVVFPDISKEPNPHSKVTRVFFIIVTVFFCVFNTVGLAFDIYGWVVPS